jgi:hypothetical protein
MKFTPQSPTIALVMTGASVPQAFNAQGTNADDVCIYNSGTVPVFVAWGSTQPTASAASFPIPPATQIVVTKGNTAAFFAAFGVSGTLYVSPGEATL